MKCGRIKRRVKVREVMQELARLGCEPQTQRGSHLRYRTPRGRRFELVVNHPGRDAEPKALSAIDRLLKAEGLEMDL